MQVSTRKLADLQPYVDNPRTISQEAVDKVAGSLLEFGWRQPIVVDEDMVIVVGHTRWMAARQLGWLDAPVHVARDMSAEKVRAYRVADNKVGEFSDWDLDKLSIEMDEIAMTDVAIEIVGFDPDELISILAEAEPEPEPERPQPRERTDSRPSVEERETFDEEERVAAEKPPADTVQEVPFNCYVTQDEYSILKGTLSRVIGSVDGVECEGEALIHLCRLYRD